MAEFCLDCHNKTNKIKLKKSDVKLSWDLCESCGKIKKTIVYINRNR